ncbi:hypothetical protein GCM10009838_41420 [Catenulispora subtropica]|uniref:Uncharacterized protein n=1 Tax=Catenulispora subtropica TaxID=450798 RepID=A0ABN2RXJ5_9ACTN
MSSSSVQVRVASMAGSRLARKDARVGGAKNWGAIQVLRSKGYEVCHAGSGEAVCPPRRWSRGRIAEPDPRQHLRDRLHPDP